MRTLSQQTTQKQKTKANKTKTWWPFPNLLSQNTYSASMLTNVLWFAPPQPHAISIRIYCSQQLAPQPLLLSALLLSTFRPWLTRNRKWTFCILEKCRIGLPVRLLTEKRLFKKKINKTLFFLIPQKFQKSSPLTFHSNTMSILSNGFLCEDPSEWNIILILLAQAPKWIYTRETTFGYIN